MNNRKVYEWMDKFKGGHTNVVDAFWTCEEWK
jgi:hypothetical protein